MADPTPMVPTLGGDPYLRDPVRIIAYILNYYFSAPKSAMITWYNEAISFKHTLARRRDSEEEILPEAVSSELTAALTRIFGSQVQVEVTLHPGENDITKILRISVSVIVDGTPHMLDKNVTLSEDGQIVYVLTSEDDEEILTP